MTIGVYTTNLGSSYRWILSDDGKGNIIEHYRHIGANKWLPQDNRKCLSIRNLDGFFRVYDNDITNELIHKVITENFEDFL